MIAKERMYQHTMGNNVAPSFLDVMEMNIYYKCRDNCLGAPIVCQHGGYAHPRDCTRCICPWGFGGPECGDLAPSEFGPSGADCGGAVLDATEGPKILEGGVSARSDYGIAERHATCFWHIVPALQLFLSIINNHFSGRPQIHPLCLDIVIKIIHFWSWDLA
jgi:hypothetical protein